MQNSSQSIPKNWAARFFTVWGGQAFSLFGSALVQFALVWYLTKETGSATVLATATLVALLPQIVLGPFVGALVDRWNRRIIMIVADSAIAVATLGLIWLFASGLIEIWHIFLLMGVRSLGGAFHQPAMTSSTRCRRKPDPARHYQYFRSPIGRPAHRTYFYTKRTVHRCRHGRFSGPTLVFHSNSQTSSTDRASQWQRRKDNLLARSTCRLRLCSQVARTVWSYHSRYDVKFPTQSSLRAHAVSGDQNIQRRRNRTRVGRIDFWHRNHHRRATPGHLGRFQTPHCNFL